LTNVRAPGILDLSSSRGKHRQIATLLCVSRALNPVRESL